LHHEQVEVEVYFVEAVEVFVGERWAMPDRNKGRAVAAHHEVIERRGCELGQLVPSNECELLAVIVPIVIDRAELTKEQFLTGGPDELEIALAG